MNHVNPTAPTIRIVDPNPQVEVDGSWCDPAHVSFETLAIGARLIREHRDRVAAATETEPHIARGEN